MDELLQKLYARWVEAKTAEAQAKAAEKEAEANVKATSEGHAWALAKSNASNRTLELNEIDQMLRAQAQSVYEETGDKHVHPNIEVRMFKVFHYDVGEMLPWVRENLPVALTIDKKVFDKVLASMPYVPPLVHAMDDARPYVSMPKEVPDGTDAAKHEG